MEKVQLGYNAHGKGRVRVVKVTRLPQQHLLKQFTAWILVEGPVEDAFTAGDNSKVLPTDTIKNTTYVIAKKTEFASIEEFGIALAKHFVTAHPNIIHKAQVHLVEDKWTRIPAKDSKGVVRPHSHAFVADNTEKRFTTVKATKCHRGGAQPSFTISSGLMKLRVMKTTQSGFVKFYKDPYTVLPEVDDRLFGTEVKAEWNYVGTKVNFNEAYDTIRAALIEAFAGPADTGVYSPSVQFTLQEMGKLALERCHNVSSILLSMPNIHNMPFDLERFGLKKDHPHGEIFYPIDEPHGTIEARVEKLHAKL